MSGHKMYTPNKHICTDKNSYSKQGHIVRQMGQNLGFPNLHWVIPGFHLFSALACLKFHEYSIVFQGTIWLVIKYFGVFFSEKQRIPSTISRNSINHQQVHHFIYLQIAYHHLSHGLWTTDDRFSKMNVLFLTDLEKQVSLLFLYRAQLHPGDSFKVPMTPKTYFCKFIVFSS